jgi:hypothetical protein
LPLERERRKQNERKLREEPQFLPIMLISSPFTPKKIMLGSRYRDVHASIFFFGLIFAAFHNEVKQGERKFKY